MKSKVRGNLKNDRKNEIYMHLSKQITQARSKQTVDELQKCTISPHYLEAAAATQAAE